jgi:hypothetical protein
MTDLAVIAERRQRLLAAAKATALEDLSRFGPEAAVFTLIDELRSDPELHERGQVLAFLHLDARLRVSPQGAGAVRAWIDGFTWPDLPTVQPPAPER